MKMYSYCGDDVRAEDGAAALIPDLTPYERQTWLVDQTINARGVRVDVNTLDHMLRIMEEMFTLYNAELKEITGGAVGSASCVTALADWLNDNGIYVDNLKAETVEEKLALLRRLKPAVANLRVGVSVMPGTEVAALALEEGLISDEAELIRPTFYLAEPVKDWIVEHLREEVAQRPRWNLM